MQKLKKVFSPGNDRDDELMYGTQASRKSADMAGADSMSKDHTRNDSALEAKDHGVSRQNLNPDGAKYDEQQYGKPAAESQPRHDTQAEEAALASRMGEPKEDSSVKRKVLDPENNQRDEAGYGTTAFSDRNTQSKPVASDFERTTKPNELGNVPPSNDSYESHRTPAAAAALAHGTQSSTPDAASRMSMKSGIVGSTDHSAEERRLQSEGITGQDTPGGAQEASSRGYGKDAALAGAGAAAGAGGIYAATRQKDQSRTAGDRDVEDATYTDRSFPLSGGAASYQRSDRPASSTYSTEAAGPRSTSSYIDPATTSSAYVDPATTSTTTSRDAGGIGPGSGSAALAGAGAGAAGSAAAEQKLADHSRHSHEFRGDPCEGKSPSPEEKTLPFVPGPHQTVAANVLDPHVPGEFPADDGSDPHGSRAGGLFGSPPRQSTTSDSHHYGRDAALAGGAGAAGLGTYAATKDRDDPSQQTTSRDMPLMSSPSQQSETRPLAQTSTPQHVAGDPVTGATEPSREHHYGRDAALAGGAGAAGAAGYSALQSDRGDTGPASKTIGPHKSNVANIVDPRVRPEPEKMKEHTTAGPWQSDTLNKLDPKVESDPNKADVKAHGYASGVGTQPQQLKQQEHAQPREQGNEKDHHYGRDAAVVGGAGGAGAAAYGASQMYGQHEQEVTAKEQEKLAKEQDKQAQHEAKERAKEQEKRAKEQEKQAKHDAEKQQKQAKHDNDKAAKEQAKEQEKAEKQRAKEQEKLAKERSKEEEKLEKEKSKEQEKLAKERSKEEEKREKERAKEQERLEKEKSKEDEKLAAARDDEAAKKHHNKLHKDAPEEREEKGGILHRIFHHKHHEREGAEGAGQKGSFDEAERPKGLDYKDADEARNASNLQALAGERGVGAGTGAGVGAGAGASSGYGQQGIGAGEGLGGDGGMVTEKHTGLPMNVGKYGSGAGGTDAGEHIQGYHAK